MPVAGVDSGVRMADAHDDARLRPLLRGAMSAKRLDATAATVAFVKPGDRWTPCFGRCAAALAVDGAVTEF